MHPIFKHTSGILKDAWPQLVALVIVIALFFWILFAHIPQLKNDFGFINPQDWTKRSKAFIKAGFDPIELPARPKLEQRECSTEEGLCNPLEGITFE